MVKLPEQNITSIEQSLSGKSLPPEAFKNLPMSNEISQALMTKEAEKAKAEAEKIKKDVEKFRDLVNKKYKFIEAIGLVPAQANKVVEQEYEVPAEEAKRGLVHVLTVIPEKQFKNIKAIRAECVKMARECSDKIWLHVMTPVDVWELCLDSRFEIVEAFSMSYPIYDKGLLGALRVTAIHKSLVMRKFDKYVTSYVIAGSLVRGEATKESDVDIFLVIDDTDVKRMSRTELLERIRSAVFAFIQDASAMAGVKNILNVQPYLLTDFWDAVKDAQPVMFTFIRDGVPLYDRGTFLPWKALLGMGKIKPSPEAIDKFMMTGDKLEDYVKRRMLDASIDIYWSVLTPTQGLLMLYGLAPPTPKETVRIMRETIQGKEKLLEKKYVDIFERIVQFYKDYEHGKHQDVKGSEIEKMHDDAVEYTKRLRELRVQLERRVSQNKINEVYDDVFKMLESMLNKKTEAAIIKEFDDKLIKAGKFPPRLLESLKYVAKVKKDMDKPVKPETKTSAKTKKAKKKGNKMGRSKEIVEVEKARQRAAEITKTLIEFNQRCDFLSMDRTRFMIKGSKPAEVLFLKNTFVVEGNKVRKLDGTKFVESSIDEMHKQLSEHGGKETKIDVKAIEVLKKEFGDFELRY
jgi:predicted nucleotidyltransferase